MGVSYNRLWKMIIDKNMKRIEMQYLTGISGNILAFALQSTFSFKIGSKTHITTNHSGKCGILHLLVLC